MEELEILGIKIHKIDMKEALFIIENFIKKGDKSYLVLTPNAEIIVRSQTDKDFARILNSSDLSTADGASILLASKFLYKEGIKSKVAGFDLMKRLFAKAVKKDYSIYLLGGKPGIAKKSKERLSKEFPGINIKAYHHGYLDKKLQSYVIQDINKVKPDLLFVGMGVPLQEKFLDKNLEKLNVRVAMTVGGSFDILAGESKRAPLYWQKLYIEWLYRLIQEPSRLGRMMSLPRFMYLILFEKFKNIKYT